MDYSGKIIKKTPVVPSQTSASGVWTLDDALQATKSNTWPVANVPDPISRSLRFRSSASAYLNRTPTTAGNRKTWTWSGWVKRGTLGVVNRIFSADDGSSSTDQDYNTLFFNSSNQLQFSGNLTDFRATTAVYRDPSAWYHIVFVTDTTQATASNRFKLYVNGVEVTSFATSNNPSQNTDLAVNASIGHYIGSIASGSYFDGYQTEINFIDGQALTPSSFGGTNAVTGVWEPRPYTGTYGTNGFLLTFSDNTSTTTLGYDTSGNSNNWTTNNISLTAGSTYDSMLDVPTQWIGYNTGDVASVTRGNYATLNPLANPNSPTVTITGGNLNFSYSAGTSNRLSVVGSIGVNTGKYYYEFTVGSPNNCQIGITDGLVVGGGANGVNFINYYSGGINNSLGSVSGTPASFTAGDIIGVAYDMTTPAVYFYKNNTLQATVTSFSSFTAFPLSSPETGAANGSGTFNFGQRPFSYTPPAGFLSLCTTNLPSPTILQGNQYFDISLYSATGSTPQTITNSGGFQPDLVWTKPRSSVGENALNDSVRGTSKLLITSSTAVEGTDAQYLTSFNSNGYSLGTNNWSATTVVGWQWKAGGAAVTNTAGSITSTVSANTTAGFSVVTFSTNASSGGATIGHGLGVAPAMIIMKARNQTYAWDVYHQSIGASYRLRLNLANGQEGPSSDYWNSTSPTSSVFSINQGFYGTGVNTVAYCFAAVAGYSAFGSYTGNGSADGTFVYTGFRPRYIMYKRSSDVGNWQVMDTARWTYNPEDGCLFPNLNNAETFASSLAIDLLSNGFKLRNTDSDRNANGSTYIYACFAESPFKNALAR